MVKKGAVLHFIHIHRMMFFVLLAILLLWAGAFYITYTRFEQTISSREASMLKTESETKEFVKQSDIKRQAAIVAEQKRQTEETMRPEEERKKVAEEAIRSVAPQQVVPNTAGSCNTAGIHANPSLVDVLVNKKHCLKPLDFVPQDLVTTHGATISGKAVGDFNRMFNDAAAAGQAFSVSSSYRSYATQVSTYNYWVSVNGQQAADTVSARPGYSEHQTGLAVDVGADGCNLNCFGGTTQYQWLQANAANYGFIQRYYAGHEAVTGYSSEEWHYRYVGVAVAEDMKAKGIKTLEQYWGMDGGNYR